MHARRAQRRRLGRVGLAAGFLWPAWAFANPDGLTVAKGSASATTQGNQLQVQVSDQAFLNWQSFNIAPGERTTFLQPSAQAIVWNRIEDPQPSKIFGQLEANGTLVLYNAAGFHFGPDAFVRAAGLVVSTAPPTVPAVDTGFLATFTDPPPGAAIVNEGRLDLGPGGSAYLLAERVVNRGEIRAPGGTVGLVAGQEVILSERPDGRGLSAVVRLPVGAIDQNGRVIADAGVVAMQARVVNQGGLIQADAVQERGGIIEMVATDGLTLGGTSTLRSHGEDSHIRADAGGDLRVESGAMLDVGGAGGDGGGRSSAASFHVQGDVRLADGATIAAADAWSVSVEARNVVFEGTATIQTARGDLAVTAGDSVRVAQGALRTVDGGNLAVTAVAGSIQTGTSDKGYLFRPNGYSVDPELGGISTANGGDVTLIAGLDIVSQLPRVGDVQTDAGSGAFGSRPGQVTLDAGRDVSGHFVVANGTGQLRAGRDVGTDARPLALSLINGGWDVSAGRDVKVQEIRNPNGVFNQFGFASSPTRQRFNYGAEAYARLTAGHGIELLGTALPRYRDAFSQSLPPIYPGTLDLRAGAGGVTLRNDVVLFPAPRGNLTITTTDGGSLVGAQAGELTHLVLSDSGRTQYRASGDFGLADHALTPVHLDDPTPVELRISRDVSGVLLGVAKAAHVEVGGDLINSRFEGQNLRSTDVTRIAVAGDLRNRNEFTSVESAAAPRPELLELAYPLLTGSAVEVANRFAYEATTHQLTFQGRMTAELLQTLLNLRVRAFDAFGVPLFDANGEPLTVAAEFAPAPVLQALYAASQDVPLNPDTGYLLGGGGRFELSAHSMDLGATLGMLSQGPRANSALARLFTRGADVHLDVTGDLEMFSAAVASLNGGEVVVNVGGAIRLGSSGFALPSVPALARGIYTVDASPVTVVAGGDIALHGSRIAAYDGGTVTVRSLKGDIDVGSGGVGAASVEKIVVDPLTRAVRSFTPTIPGSGILATTFPPSLDPAFPLSRTVVGDILIETPHGDIRARAAGVVQVALNGIEESGGIVTLRAGTRDAAGELVALGNIDVRGSGVVGGTVRLEASGDILGAVFARRNLEVAARLNVNLTALAAGNAFVSAGETLSGTLIGIGGLTAGGQVVDAVLLAPEVALSGETTTATVGFAPGTAAAATAQRLPATTEEAVEDVRTRNLAARAAEGDADEAGEGDANGRHRGPRLAPGASRVTVVLPP